MAFNEELMAFIANQSATSPTAMSPRLQTPLAVLPGSAAAPSVGAPPTLNTLTQGSPVAANQANLAQALTHAAPAPATTTVQEDLASLLAPVNELRQQAGQKVGSGLFDLVNELQNPAPENTLLQGTNAIGKMLGSTIHDLANGEEPAGPVAQPEIAPAKDTGLAAKAEELAPPPHEVPKAEDGLPPVEERTPPPPLNSAEEVAAAATDEKSFSEQMQGFFADPNTATMMMGLGVALMQGKGLGDAIASGMSALGAKKKLDASAAASKAAGERADKKLALDEREVKVKERKGIAEIRKLNKEAGKDGIKDVISLAKIIQENAPIGEEEDAEISFERAKKMVAQFKGELPAPSAGVGKGGVNKNVQTLTPMFEGRSQEEIQGMVRVLHARGFTKEDLVASARAAGVIN